jgi:hypothetical protein
MGDGELLPPSSLGCIPWTTGRRSHQVPMDRLIRRGNLSSWQVRAKALDAQKDPLRTNLGALFVLVRTQVQIQACLRRQKERLITSQRPLLTTYWGETVSLRFREWGGSVVMQENVWKWEPETQPSCEVSEESWSSVLWWTRKVKGEPQWCLRSGV